MATETVASLFQPEPQQWGLRGDPYLWREMRRYFEQTPLPTTVDELNTLIETAFEALTGHSISVGSHFFVESFNHGGMSGGHISPDFWREKAMPLLGARCAQAYREKENALDTVSVLGVGVSKKAIETRFGRCWDQVAYLADRHTMVVQSWLASRSPHAERFKNEGTMISSTGLNASILNAALGAEFPDDTSKTKIREVIESVQDYFARREVPWRWWLGPFAQPTDMSQRLKQVGMKELFRLAGLAATLPVKLPAINPEVRVRLAADKQDLQAASRIRREAFKFAPGAASHYFEDMADDWLRGNPARLYMGQVSDGPVAGIGALIMGAGVPGVYVLATLPEWERRGIARGILTRILLDAAAAGHQLMVMTAGSQASPLYWKFGFEPIFEYTLYTKCEVY